MNTKSQSAIEFSILMSVMFLIFTIFFFAVGIKLSDIQRNNEISLLEDLGTYVQNELRLASSAEDGYYREFELPKTLFGRDYDIEISDYGGSGITDVVLKYVNSTIVHEVVMPLGNVTGTIDKDASTIVIIVKQGNQVIVTT